MDLTSLIDMAAWIAATIGTGMTGFHLIGEFLDFAGIINPVGGLDAARETGQFLDGFLIVIAVLLTGFCAYQLVTNPAAAMHSKLFWVATAVAILCWASGIFLLRAKSNTADK